MLGSSPATFSVNVPPSGTLLVPSTLADMVDTGCTVTVLTKVCGAVVLSRYIVYVPVGASLNVMIASAAVAPAGRLNVTGGVAASTIVDGPGPSTVTLTSAFPTTSSVRPVSPSSKLYRNAYTLSPGCITLGNAMNAAGPYVAVTGLLTSSMPISSGSIGSVVDTTTRLLGPIQSVATTLVGVSGTIIFTVSWLFPSLSTIAGSGTLVVGSYTVSGVPSL